MTKSSGFQNRLIRIPSQTSQKKEPTDRIRSNRLCNRWYDIAGETWLVVVDVV